MREDDDAFDQAARELRKVVPVSDSFDARVMANIRRLPKHSHAALWSRLTTPRTFTISPLPAGLIAASLLALATLGAAHASVDLSRMQEPLASVFSSPNRSKAVQRVQFVLVAPNAKKVSVVGDFNEWDASRAAFQAHHRGGGVWSVTAPVPVGQHRYSFVVDDSLWVSDPNAPRVADNDYGVPNSAIVVEAQQ